MAVCGEFAIDMTASQFGVCKCGHNKGEHLPAKRGASPWAVRRRSTGAFNLGSEPIVSRSLAPAIRQLPAQASPVAGGNSGALASLKLLLAPYHPGSQLHQAMPVAAQRGLDMIFRATPYSSPSSSPRSGPLASPPLPLPPGAPLGIALHNGAHKREMPADIRQPRRGSLGMGGMGSPLTSPRETEEEEEEGAEAAGPTPPTLSGGGCPAACEGYELDLTAGQFGQCKCGQPKVEHVRFF